MDAGLGSRQRAKADMANRFRKGFHLRPVVAVRTYHEFWISLAGKYGWLPMMSFLIIRWGPYMPPLQADTVKPSSETILPSGQESGE